MPGERNGLGVSEFTGNDYIDWLKVASATYEMTAGDLTDGLPLWNMGGPVPALQLRWDATSASAGVRIRVRLQATGSSDRREEGRARSRRYQRRFLQPNTHFAALFEIYKMSWLNFQNLPNFSEKNRKIKIFFCKNPRISPRFCRICKILQNFANILKIQLAHFVDLEKWL